MKERRIPYITKVEIQELVDQCQQDFRFFDRQGVTICLLTMPGGFNIIGDNCSPNARRFDHEVGKSMARQSAIDRLWQFERYRRSMKGEVNGQGE